MTRTTLEQAALIALAIVGAALWAAPAAAEPLAVRLSTSRGDGAVFQPGDPIELDVRTNKDANLIVYEIDQEGAVHLLFPPHGPDMAVDGGQTIQLPQANDGQLVIEGPVGEGYVVAIASQRPFMDPPWYLRPYDAVADEMGTTNDDKTQDEGVTPEGKIVGDPFVAMERIRRALLKDPSDVESFATAYVTYYVHQQVKYPRYLCNDCHRPTYYSWWDGFDPYYSTCSVFSFHINAGWWWGPTYWTGYVPYYTYVYRTDCPPHYAPAGAHAPYWSSWNGWTQWNTLWGGPLRRTKSLPPSTYISPAKWDRASRPGAQELPPGYMASAHGSTRTMPASSGLVRERRGSASPMPASSEVTRRSGSDTRLPREVPVGGRWERGSQATTPARDWRGTDRPARPVERGSQRGERQSREDRPSWSQPRQEPQPSQAPPQRGEAPSGRSERPMAQPVPGRSMPTTGRMSRF